MADSSDDEGDVAEEVVPIPALPGISPDLLVYFQLRQQAAEKRHQLQKQAADKRQEKRDKRLDNERRDDLRRHREEQDRAVAESRAMREHYEQQILTLSEQISKVA